MKICIILILSLFFINRNVFSEPIGTSTPGYICVSNIVTGSMPCSIENGAVIIDFNRRIPDDYRLYECDYFTVGDKVTYSFYYVFFERTDFVGIVTKIEPKPTNEYIHLITVKRLNGKGESGIYSEQFLEQYNNKN